jgi:chromatin-remodeling ATPase INO80
LQDIDFDDEDQTNLYNHASRNAQDALAAAREKAAQFDRQAALDRKTNEALKLAKAQAHIRDDSTGPSTPAAGGDARPLVDRKSRIKLTVSVRA